MNHDFLSKGNIRIFDNNNPTCICLLPKPASDRQNNDPLPDIVRRFQLWLLVRMALLD